MVKYEKFKFYIKNNYLIILGKLFWSEKFNK